MRAQQLLLELVRTPSLSGAESEVASIASNWFQSRGIASKRLGNSVIAQIEGRQAGPKLLFNTHLDTVPAGQGWRKDPWQVDWTGDRLTGLGANDAKGCATAMMWAAAELAQNRNWSGTLQVALNASEETNNQGMADTLQELGLPDAAITGEPTQLKVIRSQAGLAVLQAVWIGQSCHAAHVARVPNQNAMLQACQDLASLPKWLEPGPPHELLGPSTLVASALQAGDRHNQIPDRAVALFDARLVPPTQAKSCVALLERHLPHARVKVQSERLRAIDTPADDRLVLTALAASGTAKAHGSTTLSDMALLQGTAAIKCGPGDTARSHTANEFLLADELEAGIRFYHNCARKWLTT
jgi:acetylornithine deacetylase